MIPEHDVYITDWADARAVPYVKGTFDLHDYVDYLVDFFRRLGPDLARTSGLSAVGRRARSHRYHGGGKRTLSAAIADSDGRSS